MGLTEQIKKTEAVVANIARLLAFRLVSTKKENARTYNSHNASLDPLCFLNGHVSQTRQLQFITQALYLHFHFKKLRQSLCSTAQDEEAEHHVDDYWRVFGLQQRLFCAGPSFVHLMHQHMYTW